MNYLDILKKENGPGFRIKSGGQICDVKNAEGVYVKDIDEPTGRIKMVWSKMDVVDAHNEVIEKGSFKKTIKEKGPKSMTPRIKWLVDHWPMDGSAGLLEELYEEGDELMAVGKRIDTLKSKMVYEESRQGSISEHSVGFMIPKGKYIEAEDNGPHIIKEVNLWEGSSLTAWGANMFTPVVEAKAADLDKIEPEIMNIAEQIKDLERLLSAGSLPFEKSLEAHVRIYQMKKALISLTGGQPNESKMFTGSTLEPNDAVQIFTKYLKS